MVTAVNVAKFLRTNADFFLLEALPCVLLLSVLIFPRDLYSLTGSNLGKCIAVCLIVAYAYIDLLYGVFVCFVFILFYQICEFTSPKFQKEGAEPFQTSDQQIEEEGEVLGIKEKAKEVDEIEEVEEVEEAEEAKPTTKNVPLISQELITAVIGGNFSASGFEPFSMYVKPSLVDF